MLGLSVSAAVWLTTYTQTRTQGLAVCSALLLTALSTIDLKVREKESVELAGVAFDEVCYTYEFDEYRCISCRINVHYINVQKKMSCGNNEGPDERCQASLNLYQDPSELYRNPLFCTVTPRHGTVLIKV